MRSGISNLANYAPVQYVHRQGLGFPGRRQGFGLPGPFRLSRSGKHLEVPYPVGDDLIGSVRLIRPDRAQRERTSDQIAQLMPGEIGCFRNEHWL